jgi:hypothetical protein
MLTTIAEERIDWPEEYDLGEVCPMLFDWSAHDFLCVIGPVQNFLLSSQKMPAE